MIKRWDLFWFIPVNLIFVFLVISAVYAGWIVPVQAVLMASVLIFASVALLVLSHSQTTRLKSLAANVTEMMPEDFQPPLKPSSGNEVVLLAYAFKYMGLKVTSLNLSCDERISSCKSRGNKELFSCDRKVERLEADVSNCLQRHQSIESELEKQKLNVDECRQRFTKQTSELEELQQSLSKSESEAMNAHQRAEILTEVMHKLDERIQEMQQMIDSSQEQISLHEENQELHKKELSEKDEALQNVLSEKELLNGELSRIKQSYEQERVSRKEIEKQVDAAKYIEQSLLARAIPLQVEREELQISSSHLSGKLHNGSFSDYFFVGPNQLMLAIADSEHRDLPGSLTIIALKAMVRSMGCSGFGPADILNRINEHLIETETGEGIRLYLAVYDLESGEIRSANAGHSVPLWYQNQGEVEQSLDDVSLLLGRRTQTRYEEQIGMLEEGEALLFFSDSAIVNIEQNEALMTVDKLVEVFTDSRARNMQTLVDDLMQQAQKNNDNKPLNDISLMAMKREKVFAAEPEKIRPVQRVVSWLKR